MRTRFMHILGCMSMFVCISTTPFRPWTTVISPQGEISPHLRNAGLGGLPPLSKSPLSHADTTNIVTAVVAQLQNILYDERVKFGSAMEEQKLGFCAIVADQSLTIDKLTAELKSVRSEVLPLLTGSPPGSPRAVHRQQMTDSQRTQQQQQQ